MSTIDEILFYCREKNTFGALMVTGKWGSGKTYLIDNQLRKALGDEYIIIRVSLFGEANIESIHAKVKREYLQELMISLVEQADEKIAKKRHNEGIEKKSNVIIQSLKGESKKTSKFAKIFKYFCSTAKKVPMIEKYFLQNINECVSIEAEIGQKQIILVFDDLERSNLEEVDVLGCVNEYCENKKIKTIIVANEDKIRDKEAAKDGFSLPYSEIKEKIIIRTVKNEPNYEMIIMNLINSYESENKDYLIFLNEQKEEIVNIFLMCNFENIRSMRSAIQDFERVFQTIKSQKVEEEIKLWLYSFVIFELNIKAGVEVKNEKYGYLLSDSEFEKKYTGYYFGKYVPRSLKNWLVEGQWIEENVIQDIKNVMRVDTMPKTVNLIACADIMDLEEDKVIEKYDAVLNKAYEGKLNIEEYVMLIKNIACARDISYHLPTEVDYNLLNEGVEKCFDRLIKSDKIYVADSRLLRPEEEKMLKEEERVLYDNICLFVREHVQMHAINSRKYIHALESGSINNLYACGDLALNVFDEEMAEKAVKCYEGLNNRIRRQFIDLFARMWGIYGVPEYFNKDVSQKGFELLIKKLEGLEKSERSYNLGIKAAITKDFIGRINDILDVNFFKKD